MECIAFVLLAIIAIMIYFASRNRSETHSLRPPDQYSRSSLNGLFTLFLLDHWLEGGSRGLFGDPGETQDAFDEDGQDDWEDREDEDDYLDDQAGF